MSRIVISYRRADSAAISGRIFDRLSQRYGTGSVFIDVDEIPFGIDFREHIAEVLAVCDVVIAVMGPRWVTGTGDVPRIMEDTDPVRIEVQAALERGIPVIPVLVEGASMPEPADLPAPLTSLAYRNACEVASGRDFHAHVDRLIRAIDRLVPDAAPSEPKPALAEPQAPLPPARSVRPVASSRFRTAALILFLALPQIAQFSMRKEAVLIALIASTIGVVALMDEDGRPLLKRLTTGAVAALGNILVQGAAGLARASLLPW
ncbi:toll/interleukin-1 receptor domain-containing protein [Enterovirga rhinocerotis]|uniref:TIR domain-containing protein n=1 Tax=Enterovirga rhinocerotis TaxID=1339210 RepID=A0A4R7CBU9_9HYPH|nr:toll/interleukin-1 receptor domain-containing protein [Enterovirga rhinocerotis]TDR94247.1 TIR domain-containing protein [Enterovirga rhinocerotis]